MRIKHIAALITFFATFAFSAFIALLFASTKILDVPPVNSYEFRSNNRCYRKNTGDKIREFLEQDKQNGFERRSDTNLRDKRSKGEDTLRDYIIAKAASTSEYAAKSNSMDASEFPREFQIVWREHMRAWKSYSDFLQKEKTGRIDYDEFRWQANEHREDISSTWHEVLRVGREHGADLPDDF